MMVLLMDKLLVQTMVLLLVIMKGLQLVAAMAHSMESEMALSSDY